MTVLHWLGHWTGISDEAGAGYGFWSGIGSGSPILAGIALYIRHHNCHEHGCWRLGKHVQAGTPYVKCAKHHPDVP